MKPKLNQRPKQPIPKELTDSLLDFLRRKFYSGNAKAFFQQRSKLLAWVVLWPASWLTSRGAERPAHSASLRGQPPATMHPLDQAFYPELGRLLGPAILKTRE